MLRVTSRTAHVRRGRMIALLKLVDENDAASGAERRVFPRKEVQGEAVGRRVDHSLAALRQPVLRMSLRDVSAGGLWGLSDPPIPAGGGLRTPGPGRGMFGR